MTRSRLALLGVALVAAFAWGRCGVSGVSEAETQLATAQQNAQVALTFARETRYQLAEAERELTAARAVTDRAARSGRTAMAAADSASAASRAYLGQVQGPDSLCATLLAAQVAATDTLAAAFTTYMRDALAEREATDRTLAAAHTALAAADTVVAAKDRVIAAQDGVLQSTRKQGRIRVLAALAVGFVVGVVIR